MTATNGHVRNHGIEDRWHHLVEALRGIENGEPGRMRSLAGRLRERIEAHPIAAVAAAFAAGYVVTRLVRRVP